MTIMHFRKTDFLPSSKLYTRSRRPLIITVDGPAASGKGTLARRMAARLGYAYLDTGALYRAVALATLETGGNPMNWECARQGLDIVKRNLTPELLANPAIRTAEVSQAASKVAAIPEVREALLQYQRDFAHTPPGSVGGVVLDGRDIGTVICPDADIKFFVTASPEERAERRYNELKPQNPALTLDMVLADLQARDKRDRERSVAPTFSAPDAYILDTTGLTPAETLEESIAVIRSRFLEETADMGPGSRKAAK